MRETTTGDNDGRQRETTTGDNGRQRPQRETTPGDNGRQRRETTTGDNGRQRREATGGNGRGPSNSLLTLDTREDPHRPSLFGELLLRREKHRKSSKWSATGGTAACKRRAPSGCRVERDAWIVLGGGQPHERPTSLFGRDFGSKLLTPLISKTWSANF